MKGFFKFTFASILGVIIGLILFIFIIVLVVSASSREKPVVLKSNTLLIARLDQKIVDRNPESPFDNLGFGTFTPDTRMGLDMIVDNLQNAKNDPNIKGLLLDLTINPTGIATLEEIRNAILDFRTSGKFVICYADIMTHGSYYLATAADKIYLTPEGNLEFIGLASRNYFIKKALDKLGIDAQVIRVGEYKGFAEPFIYTGLSDENREQIRAYTGSIWNTMLTNISKARNIPIAELNSIADNMSVTDAPSAVEKHFIDGVKYKDELISELKELTGKKESEDLSTVSITKYSKVPRIKNFKGLAKDKIAVVYASGDIVIGEGNNGNIGDKTFSSAIREARKDSTVKAIVLRVNSGGGSALASDIIWREVKLAAETKPVIASMGDVAASGGYYILAAANKIYADPNTITGSIGVIGILPDMEEFMNDKLGITYDVVKTNKNSDFGTIFRPLNPSEMKVLENQIGKAYKTFISHVADGRDIPVDKVDRIGRGHVYSALDAKGLGLVDEIGGLKEALAAAAESAGLENYRIVKYPKFEAPLQKLVSEFTGDMQAKILEEKLGKNYTIYKQIEMVENMKGIQARIPYSFSVE